MQGDYTELRRDATDSRLAMEIRAVLLIILPTVIVYCWSIIVCYDQAGEAGYK